MAQDSFLKLPEQRKEAILTSGTQEFAAKNFGDASTDIITRNCGISKGLLFHYFGSKREFYLYCLEQALGKIVTDAAPAAGGDFYETIFYMLDTKVRLCRQYPDETAMVNMAAREASTEVQEGKNRIVATYLARARIQSAQTMEQAMALLKIKPTHREKAQAALTVYAGALIRRYMEAYETKPGEFLEKAEQIKMEIRVYLDCLLYGIAEED